MAKIFKNIRRSSLRENKIIKYLGYAVGEIILVVIGILIALSINNGNNLRIEKENEKKSYLNIKRQVLDDKNELTKVEGINAYYSKIYEYGNKIIIAQNLDKVDSLAMITMGLSQYSDFHRSSNIYETLVNSGDLKILKNDQITSSIQKLENTYILINKLENIHWEIIINELSPQLRGVINYATAKPVEPAALYGVELQNFFIESIYLTTAKDSVYNKALKEINEVVDLIDEELKLDDIPL